MKKVLVLTTTFPRWVNDTTPPFVFKLSSLIGRKYKIIVLAPHHFGAKKKELMENLEVNRFSYFFPKKYQKVAYGAGILTNVNSSFLAKLQVPFFLNSEIKAAKRIIKNNDIKLLHAHWMVPSGFIGVLLKKKFNIPLIVTVHGSDLFPLKNKFFRHLQKTIVENADVVTISSETARKELISRFPKIKNKVIRITMGIDTSIFRQRNVKNRFVEYKNNKIILFVGRLNEQKGVEYLIKAIQKVKNIENSIKLLVIGGGDYKIKLKGIVDELGLKDYVEFLGPKAQKEIVDYYNLADVFVLPSVTSKIGTEALGLVLVEAMSCGTCVIGSSSGGIKEVISDGNNGLIFKEKDSDDIFEKIIRVLKDKKLNKKLRKNGIQYARAAFDWEIISEKFLKIYGGLIK